MSPTRKKRNVLSLASPCLRLGLISAIAAVSMQAGAASEPGQEGRNFDARIQMNAQALVQPAPTQLQAVEHLRREVPDLAAEFDTVMGTTRSIYNRMGYLTKPGRGDHMDLGLEFVQSRLGALGLTAGDLEDYEVTDTVFSKVAGTTHIYLRQTHEGIPVYNGQLHINVARDGQILSVNNAFVPRLAEAINRSEPAIKPSDAVQSFAQHLGISTSVSAIQRSSRLSDDAASRNLVSASGLAAHDIEAHLMWLPVRAGDVRLVWNFSAKTVDRNHHYDATVDAVTGQVLTRFDWVSSGTYRVYEQPVEDPTDASPAPPGDGRTLVVNPEDSSASPNGWFSGGTMDGNNVHACPDVDANNVCDSNPQCTGTTCDFANNLTGLPASYIPAAVTNLFYWNNLIHDIQYQYGFDEAGGNFQENNFGNGGVGSDSVNADAQDTSFPAPCNANFDTPPDGSNPRMQMFTCNNSSPDVDGDYDNGVIVHEYGHGISTRQVGGPSNSSCLNNNQQAGEGWSDWFALVYTARASHTGALPRGLGSYLFNATTTIRDLPYSTNNAVNNHTYSSIAGAAIPHGIGSRWAQAAWDVYWALVDKHGFESDLGNFDISDANEAGNKRALFYINEGLKNTACSPTFINARDGVIQAATASFGGADVCTIWEAFAAFGLGTNASTGGSNSTTATNGFNLPAACDDPPPPPPGCSNELHGATFETGADGWTNNGASTCSTGAYVQGTPGQQTNGGVTTQVGGAASGSGAWFTATNTSAGNADVDNGTCDSRSPSVSASAGDVTISFDYFHGQRDAGGDAADGFVVDVLNNGSVVSTVVNIGDVTRNAAWTSASATVSLASAGNIQLRVRTTDGSASGDLVEGGIDNVQICGEDGGPPPPPPGDSCVGFCGGQSDDGCWCDSQCAGFGDCCPDKVPVCGP